MHHGRSSVRVHTFVFPKLILWEILTQQYTWVSHCTMFQTKPYFCQSHHQSHQEKHQVLGCCHAQGGRSVFSQPLFYLWLIVCQTSKHCWLFSLKWYTLFINFENTTVNCQAWISPGYTLRSVATGDEDYWGGAWPHLEHGKNTLPAALLVSWKGAEWNQETMVVSRKDDEDPEWKQRPGHREHM